MYTRIYTMRGRLKQKNKNKKKDEEKKNTYIEGYNILCIMRSDGRLLLLFKRTYYIHCNVLYLGIYHTHVHIDNRNVRDKIYILWVSRPAAFHYNIYTILLFLYIAYTVLSVYARIIQNTAMYASTTLIYTSITYYTCIGSCRVYNSACV